MATTDIALLVTLCGAFLLPVLSSRTPLVYSASLRKLSSFLALTVKASVACTALFSVFVAGDHLVRWFTRKDISKEDSDDDGNAAGDAQDPPQRIIGAYDATNEVAGVELQPIGASTTTIIP